MTYRVEILCAGRLAEPFMDPDKLCYSHRFKEDRPISGERSNVEVGAAEARKLARDAGWIFIGRAWRCPACKPKADPVG